MLRYGLIGGGMMGQEHIRNVALIDGATVAAVADPDPAMCAQAAELAGGAKAHESAEEMLASEALDALVIAAPNDLHRGLMELALAYGKPILCEKPMATTAMDARAVAAQARTGPPVWVAMEYRFMPPVARLLEARHEIGHHRMMTIREHRFPFLPKVGDWNRFSARTGGTLIEKCCHFFDLMRLTLGADPLRVFASAGMDVNHLDESYEGRRPDILDNAYVIVDFEGGARAMLELCMFAEGSRWQETVSLTGDRARIEARVPGPARFNGDKEHHGEFRTAPRDGQERAEVVETPEHILRAGDHHGATYFQHQGFARMVAEGGAPQVTLEDGLWSVRMGEAAELSARLRRVVEISET